MKHLIKNDYTVLENICFLCYGSLYVNTSVMLYQFLFFSWKILMDGIGFFFNWKVFVLKV